MIRTKIAALLLVLSAAGSIMTSTATEPEDGPEVVEVMEVIEGEMPDDSIAIADSLALAAARQQAIADSLTLVAADESYRALTLLRSEYAPDSVLYPAVYRCYTDNLAALAVAEESGADFQKCKSVLRDISRDLEAGAYYYSSVQNQDEMKNFAAAFVDTQLLPAFASETFIRDVNSFPQLVYIAASGAFNKYDYNKAIDYFKLFFTVDTANPELREKVYMYMAQACLNAKRYDLAVSTLLNAIKEYPDNELLVTFGIKACTDGGHAEHLQTFLDRGFMLKPGDPQLLSIQGKLYEDEQQYLKALDIYRRLDELKPNTLSVAQHTALCYYNLGVSYFNNAIMEEDEKAARRLKRQANDYFSSAVEKLEEVVANDPMSVKYLRSLAVAYGCLDDQEKFDELNRRITALGEAPVGSFRMPPMVAYNESNTSNYGRSTDTVEIDTSGEIPVYADYAKSYVEKRLAEWTRKGEFEKAEDYTARVNDATIRAEYEKACAEAQDEYLDKYARRLRLNDLKLCPYDAGNEVYMIESSYGPIYIKVPLKDGEAEMFKSNWAGVQFKSPRYYIADNEVKIASLTFVTPTGRTYEYRTEDALAYTPERVNVDFQSILSTANVADAGRPAASGGASKELSVTRMSDVDENIPVAKQQSPRTLALIIANENYHNVSKVESALHDGEIFERYCRETLGLPAENIRIFKDATLGAMLRAVSQIKNAVRAMDGDCNLIVYYAGHGLPDEQTKDAYLLPVDGDPLTSESCMSLNRFYEELGGASDGPVMVFLDACFSGANRDGSMLSEARGVVMKPKESDPRGNMFVLSATSGQETALPYKEKNHGLFTYYLLKKLQETKGNVSLQELSDDVIKNVRRQSSLINNKPQNPQVSVAGPMKEDWQKRKLRER